MDSTPAKKTSAPLWVGLGTLLTVGLIFLSRGSPPDGVERSPFSQFLGRYHPMVVHLPIAFLLLLAALEACSTFRRWAQLRGAVNFVLWLTVSSTLVAALDGWLLARSGGYKGDLVTRHMWGGVQLAVVCLIMGALKAPSLRRTALLWVYRLLLALAIVLLCSTAHLGGTLSHGEGYLTEYMPVPLRTLLGIPPPKPRPHPAAVTASSSLYDARIAPLVDANCVSCHGPKKIKGGLRMDSYALLMKGGDDGAVIEPWVPDKSEMVRRITLPPDDDDFMPSGGKKPLSPDEVKLLEQWIAAGASDRQPNISAKP